jgi:Xaa-Pro aminopeptidase
MDHKGRLQRLQESLQRNKLDSLLVSHLPNVRYLCGFTGSAGLLLVTQDKSVFFTDGRYTAQARAEVQGARIVIARQAAMAAAAAWLTTNTKRSGKRSAVGVEGEHLTVGAATRLAAELGSRFRVRESPGLVEQMRIIKDAEEIALLREAVWLGASLFEVALRSIRPGVKETAVAAEMEYAARKAGAEGMSFETIIASGERSALPHGRASEAAIAAEGFVVCDFGVILAGHCSDMTRTVYVGRPGDQARAFYEAVREAQQAAVEAVRPGATLGEVDGAARKHLRKNGLDKYFTHSTGHGVGLEIHEAPRVATGQAEELRAGMVITIEPGAYIPGKWGVRIEDMVVVTEQGHEVLTPSGKELIAL